VAAADLIPPGGGEVIGDSPERRVEILCDDAALNATLSRFAPGREGADLHVHREHSDLFFVLEGTLTVRLGVEDRQVAVPAGRVARVPPGVVHGFRNASDADLRYLNFHAPGRRFNDYLRALRDGRTFAYDQFDPPQDGGVPATAASIGPPELDAPELQLAVRSEPPAPGGRLDAIYVLDGRLLLDGAPAPAGTGATLAPGVAVAGSARCLHVRVP
jgi:mannose-6-phosphate isomerase-like protein (cupin superfamily)